VANSLKTLISGDFSRAIRKRVFQQNRPHHVGHRRVMEGVLNEKEWLGERSFAIRRRNDRWDVNLRPTRAVVSAGLMHGENFC
jgi:hypothetical protein